MRLGLVILLSLLMTGCALWRKDKEEPVENGPRQEKAEPVLKPSEAMQADKKELASPVSDHFYMRGGYFQGNVATELRIDSTDAQLPDGTLLRGEEDLGLDDVVDQARMEFNFRLGERNQVRFDYFKLNRFGEAQLAQDVEFGDFSFDAGDTFRTKLDWRTLSMSYTYSLFRSESFEAGLGMALYILEIKAEGGEPGTLNRDRGSEAGLFPTIAANAAYRISKRWAITGRVNQLKLVNVDDAEGQFLDWHADIQYRWRKNFAVGLGYTQTNVGLELSNVDEPFLYNLDVKGPELFFRASF
jgi:hypothetical protein